MKEYNWAAMSVVEQAMAREYARTFTKKQRDAYAKSGIAMSDGSFPIPDRDAYRRAIKLWGHASNPAAAKRHICKRARALGISDDWTKANCG